MRALLLTESFCFVIVSVEDMTKGAYRTRYLEDFLDFLLSSIVGLCAVISAVHPCYRESELHAPDCLQRRPWSCLRTRPLLGCCPAPSQPSDCRYCRAVPVDM